MPPIAAKKTPAKKRRKGHGKGQSFEREVSRRLSLWLTKGARDDVFWRTAMSGGRATLQAKKGIINFAQAGDIGAIDPLGAQLLNHVTIECKFYRDLVLFKSLLQGTGKIAGFWEKHYDEARLSQREPFMIARENLTPTLLLTTKNATHLLGIRSRPVMEVFGWHPRSRIGSSVLVFLFDKVVPTLKHWREE